MIRYLVSAAIILLTASVNAQWSQLSNFSGQERFAANSFIVNDEIFVVGGIILDNGVFVAFNELWKYDPLNDSWSARANYPGGNLWGGIVFVIDSLAYVGLGADVNGNQTKQIWAYNPKTDQWNQKANFPGSTRSHGFAFAASGKGYVGCGQEFIGGNINYKNDFWEYDPIANNWTQKGNYIGNGLAGNAVIVIDNTPYVGLGDDGSNYYNDFYSYDPVLDQWNVKISYPGSNRSFCHTASTGRYGLIVGGEGISGGPVNENWNYDHISGNWNNANDFTSNARMSGVSFYHQGSIYMGLGVDVTGTGYKDFWKLDFNVGTNESETLEEIRVYPNPSSGAVSIELPSTQLQTVKVILLDIFGKEVDRQEYQNQQKIELDIMAPPGMYILQIVFDEQIIYRKLQLL